MSSIRSTWVFVLGCLCFIAAGPAPAWAQEGTEAPDTSFFDVLARRLGHESFEAGLTLQLRGDVQLDPSPEDRNGFRSTAARVRLRGALDGGFAYRINTDFTKTPILIDARLTYSRSPAFVVDAGLFKSPFSGEYLRPAPVLDFIERSRVVVALAPARQVGVAVSGTLPGTMLTYEAGVFNGDGRSLSPNRDDTFLYTARLSAAPRPGAGRLEAGVNVAYENTAAAPRFPGTANQLFVGADARYELPDWFFSGEVIRGTLDERFIPDRHPYGYHLTAGYAPATGSYRLLVRLDGFQPDLPARPDGASDTDPLVILGARFDFTRAASLQINHIIPTGDPAFDRQHLTAMFQLNY